MVFSTKSLLKLVVKILIFSLVMVFGNNRYRLCIKNFDVLYLCVASSILMLAIYITQTKLSTNIQTFNA
jgi:hypothetical protein